MNRLTAIPVLAAFLALAACGASELTPSQEYYVGRGVAAQALFDGRGDYAGIHADPGGDVPEAKSLSGLEEYLHKVGLTIALNSDRPDLFKTYRFAAVKSDDVNAFAAPGGFILVTTGALKMLESEDELAGVLAHEIAHVNLRHPEDHANRAATQAGAMDALNQSAGFAAWILSLFGYGREAAVVSTLAQGLGGVLDTFTKELMVNGYGRDSELAADALAVNILCRPEVRYDPRGLVAFIQRLPKKERGAWSTHPGLDGRIQSIEAEIKKQTAPLPAVNPARTLRFKKAVAEVKGLQ